MRCLDLGCGGGEVTFDLARLVWPTGSVVGIDMDESMLALARLAIPAQGVSNVEFVAADVTDWDDPDAYDVVYSRFLLQHLSSPVDMLRRMWRGGPGGGGGAGEGARLSRGLAEPRQNRLAVFP